MIKNSDIIALIVENPTLSIEKLAKKQQITISALRTKIESFKRSGILKREGSRKSGRWVFTSKFGGCSSDGEVLINEAMELDRDLFGKVQEYADSRGIPVSVAIHELLVVGVKDEP